MSLYLLSGLSDDDISLLENRVLQARNSGNPNAIKKAESDLELGKAARITQQRERNRTIYIGTAIVVLIAAILYLKRK